jgi:hypothetical protein
MMEGMSALCGVGDGGHSAVRFVGPPQVTVSANGE